MNSPIPLSGPRYFEDALHDLLAFVSPVPVREVARAGAAGRVVAEGICAATPLPPRPLARIDGWAAVAIDLVGASAMAPVMLAVPPFRVGAGALLPPGCDAVLAPDLIEQRGPLWLAMGEALPGEGVLGAGEWLRQGDPLFRPGQRLGLVDLLLAEAAGIDRIACHVPRVLVIDVGASGAVGMSSRAVMGWLGRMGAMVDALPVPGRDARSLAAALSDVALSDEGRSDLIVMIGGTGQGAADETAQALGAAGQLIAEGMGYSSAPTTILGRLGACPVVGLPGSTEAALAACLGVLQPLILRLGAQAQPIPLALPLLRKVSSLVGQAELLLLERQAEGWMPVSLGITTPEALRRADAMKIVASGDEGWPAGALLEAGMLEGWK